MAKVSRVELIGEVEGLISQLVEQLTHDEASAVLCEDGSIMVGVMCEYSSQLAADIFAISSRINRIEWRSVYTMREKKVSKTEE